MMRTVIVCAMSALELKDKSYDEKESCKRLAARVDN